MQPLLFFIKELLYILGPLYCPVDKTRAGFGSLIEQSFKRLREIELPNYKKQLEALKEKDIAEIISSKEGSSWIIIFIETLLNMVCIFLI